MTALDERTCRAAITYRVHTHQEATIAGNTSKLFPLEGPSLPVTPTMYFLLGMRTATTTRLGHVCA